MKVTAKKKTTRRKRATTKKDPSNGGPPREVKLTNEERLTLQNADLRKRMLRAYVEQEGGKIDEMTAKIVHEVKERAGIDLQQYQIDYENGIATLPSNAPVPVTPPGPANG